MTGALVRQGLPQGRAFPGETEPEGDAREEDEQRRGDEPDQ
ncbi:MULTISPECIES: hypothetical protein [unclassified Streptomyces]